MRRRGFGTAGAAGSFTSPWMQYYVIYALGRVTELGFADKALLSYTGKWLTDMIRTSGNPYASAIYQLPVEKSGGGYIPNWAEVLAVFTPEYLANGAAAVFRQKSYCGWPAGLGNTRALPIS